MRVCYTPKTFSTRHLEIIERADAICIEYAAQGFTLTLRQLYYQFVSRGWIANKDTEYHRLGGIINDARLAGHIDWDHVEDRTRSVRENSHWTSPESILRSCEAGYAIDKWANQKVRPYVLIEKDALIGVIEGVCEELDVPYFSCRGFTSASALRDLALRMLKDWTGYRKPLVLHLGDHDPSGIDMTRDVTDRLALFVEHEGFAPPEVRRLALNMDQIDQYQPPPNPAKTTDSRFAGYRDVYGDESWELDALEPTVIAGLIRAQVEGLRDDDVWDADVGNEDDAKATLGLIAKNWIRVSTFVRNGAS